MTDLITIAIPCYNRIEYFDDAIKGALNQSVPCRILVVDNASPTNDYELACSLLADPRIRYVRNESNIGMFGNWNRCIELCETPFVQILGDDDLISPRYVECFLRAYNENPEIDLFFSAVRHTGSSDELFCSNDGRKVPYGWFHNEELRWWAGFRGMKMPSVSASFRTSLFRKGGFNTKRHSANDYEFLYSLPKNHLVYGAPEELYTYRIHAMADTARNYGIAFSNYPFVYHQAAELARKDYPGFKGLVLGKLLLLQARIAMRWWADAHRDVARGMVLGGMQGYEDLVDLMKSHYPEVFKGLSSDPPVGQHTMKHQIESRLIQGLGFVFARLQQLGIQGAGAP